MSEDAGAPAGESGSATGDGAAAGGDRFDPDPEKAAFIREIAEEVAAESSESRQLANVLYRVSDLYDEDEDTSPREIYLNVRNILEVKERGGLER